MIGLPAPMRPRALWAALWLTIGLTPGAAQADMAAELVRLSTERCITPMSTGLPPNVDGLSPLDDVASSAFSDAAVTPDDQIAIDVTAFHGLRNCHVATDTRRVRLDDETLEDAKAVFAGLALTLLADGPFVEQRITGGRDHFIGGFLVEEGDFLRRLATTAQGRDGLYLEVSLMTAAYNGEIAIRVSEHYGTPPEEFSLR